MRLINDIDPFSVAWLFFTGLVGVIFSSKMEQAATEVKGVVVDSLYKGLSIAESAKAGARVVLGSNDHAALELAGTIAVRTQDPTAAALGASGCTALGGKINLIGGVGLALLFGIGVLYFIKSVKKSMKTKPVREIPEFSKTKKVSKYISWGVTSLSSVAGIVGYRSLALNSFEFPCLILCLGAAYGIGKTVEDSFLYSIFSHPEIKTMQHQTKILYDRNKDLMDRIRQQMLDAAIEEKIDYHEPKDDTPDEMVCPITKMIINDPVVPADAHGYERRALQKWYDRGGTSCPLNPIAELKNPRRLPTDENLKRKIEVYLSSYSPPSYQTSSFNM